MKKILVPIDFSGYSMAALDMACYIAKKKNMSIKLLQVLENNFIPYYNLAGISMVDVPTDLEYMNKLKENVDEQMGMLVDKVRKKGIESVESEVVIDKVFHGIDKEIRRQQTDLIIMGAKGTNDVEGFHLGSIAEKVIRTSATPVLTVNSLKPNYDLKRIVFASDFEEDYIEPILKRVIDLAAIFNSELFLLRVATISDASQMDKIKNRMKEYAQKFDLPEGSINLYTGHSEEEGIVKYAYETNADLIAICTHGRTGLSQLFNSSIAEEVAEHSNIPVLMYNISKKKIDKSARPITRERHYTSENENKERI